MTLKTYYQGGRFEGPASYCRAKRVGPFVWVAGTTAIEPTGELHAPGDAYAQSIFALDLIRKALEDVGAEMRHVVRTTAFLSDLAEATPGWVKAHGEVFDGIDPVMSAVEAGLTRPGMMVEILIDAVIFDEDGGMDFT